MEILDRIAEVCKKVCYIALCVLLLMVLADRVRAEESVDLAGTIAPPAAVIVEAETDEVTGLTFRNALYAALAGHFPLLA